MVRIKNIPASQDLAKFFILPMRIKFILSTLYDPLSSAYGAPLSQSQPIKSLTFQLAPAMLGLVYGQYWPIFALIPLRGVRVGIALTYLPT